jgi:hypothetical protein
MMQASQGNMQSQTIQHEHSSNETFERGEMADEEEEDIVTDPHKVRYQSESKTMKILKRDVNNVKFDVSLKRKRKTNNNLLAMTARNSNDNQLYQSKKSSVQFVDDDIQTSLREARDVRKSHKPTVKQSNVSLVPSGMVGTSNMDESGDNQDMFNDSLFEGIMDEDQTKILGARVDSKNNLPQFLIE